MAPAETEHLQDDQLFRYGYDVIRSHSSPNGIDGLRIHDISDEGWTWRELQNLLGIAFENPTQALLELEQNPHCGELVRQRHAAGLR